MMSYGWKTNQYRNFPIPFSPREASMKVLIIEIESGRVAAAVPVIIQGANYTPSDAEYFNEAWRTAVEDGIVDANKRRLYRFELRGAAGP